MTASSDELVVLDQDTGTWNRYPWQEVHARAELVAARILAEDSGGAVGLVGESTVDLVAAIQGVWLAGRSVSILPGPVRGADPQRRLWLLVASALPRHGTDLSAQRRGYRGADVAGSHCGVRDLTFSVADVAQRQRGHHDRCAELRL